MPEPARVLVVAPAALLHQEIPQPDGQVLCELLTGYPDRAPKDQAEQLGAVARRDGGKGLPPTPPPGWICGA